MGLMTMIKETVHTIKDMGNMTKLQETLTSHIESLHDDGKCPEGLWDAYETFQAEGEAIKNEKDNTVASKRSMAALHTFIEELEKYEDKLPDKMKEEVETYAKIGDEVENLTNKFIK